MTTVPSVLPTMGHPPHSGRSGKRHQEDAVVHVASSPQPKRAKKGTALNGCGLPPLLDFSQLREAASRHACRDKPPLVGASRGVSRKRLSLVEDAASDTDAPAKRACQFARSKPDTAAAAATKYCGTAEGLEKVLDFPVPSSSSNAHAFRPRDAEQRSPDKPQRIMAHASQLLAAVQQQQQQQQAGNIAADQAEGSAAGAAAGQEEDKEWQRLFALMELYPKQQGSTAATVAAAGAQCAAVQGAAVQLQPAAVPGTPAKQDQQAPLKTPSSRPGSFLRSEFLRVCQQRTAGSQS